MTFPSKPTLLKKRLEKTRDEPSEIISAGNLQCRKYIYMSDIFIIKQLWIDSMENEYGAAQGYSVIGFVRTEDEAQEMCSKDYVTGEGWPFEKGSKVPKFCYSRIPELFKQ